MPQRNDLSRSLVDLDQQSTLIAVIEISQSSWLVAGIVPGLERHPLKKLDASEAALLVLLRRWQDEASRAGRTIKRIAIAFEAGRDGFWLARWLRARNIEAYVIHPTSVAVSRENRRAKTDRLDTELLKRAFLGWLRGEPDHCSMAAIPTLEEEDARRPSREREGLVGERTRILNRIRGTLARLGIRSFKLTLRNAAERLMEARTPEGVPLPRNTLAELRRDIARLRFVKDQIKQIEEARSERLQQDCAAGPNAMVRLLARVIGVGIETADMLVHEILSRNLRDRKALARYAGLTGSPDESGAKRRERRPCQGGQCPCAPRNAAVGLALPQVPARQRPGAMVSGADRGWPRQHAQDHDHSPCAEALDHAVAVGDHRRGIGEHHPASGDLTGAWAEHERRSGPLWGRTR